MTLKVAHTQTPQLCTSNCFPSATVLKNHQGWFVSRQLDTQTGVPVFCLVDPYGFSHRVTEFIIENLGPHIQQELAQLKAPEEQGEWLCQHLQNKLTQATSYQIHIEQYGHQLAVRFGDYGLKGGGNEKNIAMGLSGAAVVAGITLTALSGGWVVVAGGALISSGLSSGGYAYQEEGENFQKWEYAK